MFLRHMVGLLSKCKEMECGAIIFFVILAAFVWTVWSMIGGPDSCNGSIQSHLRFGCTSSMSMANQICCHNSEFAEPSGYFNAVGGSGGLFGHLDTSGVTTFYDSVCGKPLFHAPIGRSFADWRAESEEHGWPSFRAAELVKKNVVIHSFSGEMRSVCGTHLGHNIPDGSGDRYCIDLVCIAGSPLINMSAATSLASLGGSVIHEERYRASQRGQLTDNVQALSHRILACAVALAMMSTICIFGWHLQERPRFIGHAKLLVHDGEAHGAE
eukprot:gnl/MRDRNA2_/MRDRNA2_68477_c0_seq1.p1 gnl/MRDRNA2_/MRDRNA2_68477_c0~~gnl/MRDRNA2_/MRDRNA2_68477_c0_seq1.p1  ORF type:complete len:270 (+),score=30.96 gnl/MRDRNA2_/MRDRNA2_68477_c0_seq1:67-876(+)